MRASDPAAPTRSKELEQREDRVIRHPLTAGSSKGRGGSESQALKEANQSLDLSTAVMDDAAQPKLLKALSSFCKILDEGCRCEENCRRC